VQNNFQNLFKGVFAPRNAGQSPLTTEEQTRLSWAKSIESYAAVPKVYKNFLEPFFAAGIEFPYTVLSPSYEGFIHRTTEKLICGFNRQIYVLERSGNVYDTKCFPLEGISYVEVRAILLDSHFKISGVTKDGVPATSSIRYNTVTDYLFTPLVDKIRLAAVGTQGAVQKSEAGKFDYLFKVNYKFMNYANRSLLGEEKVIHAILQPEIKARLLVVLGRMYYRSIAPTHMSILTDRELILIREETRQSGDDRYGGIWDYIPLNKIADLSLGKKDSSLLKLSILLPENDRLELLYSASARQELDQLLIKFGELTKN
jgi:hypothetical protein